MLPGIALTAVALAVLLGAEALGHRRVEWVAKPLASTGFILAAISNHATESAYGRTLLAGLALAMLGDVLLIPKSQPTFLAGLGAFLLGHVAYALAFVVRGTSFSVTLASAALLAIPARVVGRWLWPHVPGPMRAPVLAYIVVISAMVALALGTVARGGGVVVLVGAVMFYASDLSVARDRFVAPGFANRVWGLPLYYAAQLVLASTAS
jgi:uncharacterized membrane protein YhhN